MIVASAVSISVKPRRAVLARPDALRRLPAVAVTAAPIEILQPRIIALLACPDTLTSHVHESSNSKWDSTNIYSCAAVQPAPTARLAQPATAVIGRIRQKTIRCAVLAHRIKSSADKSASIVQAGNRAITYAINCR